MAEQLSDKYNTACHEIRSLGLSHSAAEKLAKPDDPVVVELQGPGEFDTVVVQEKLPGTPNLVADGGFEQLHDGYPVGWARDQKKFLAIGPTYYVWTDWNHAFRPNRGPVEPHSRRDPGATIEALPHLIGGLRQRGLEPLPLDRLIRRDAYVRSRDERSGGLVSPASPGSGA